MLQKAKPENPQNYDLVIARAFFIKGNILLSRGQKERAHDSFKAAKVLAAKYPKAPQAVSLIRNIEQKEDD